MRFNNALINENVLSDSAKDETKHQVCGPIINMVKSIRPSDGNIAPGLFFRPTDE